ncbi:MAG: hypothetical protein CVV51_04675 [Spirochaetae bacterium HGW-Spirochaetae-7]|jgi:hypothetical protein|nr:MAG: hypothetical protein CVV51_04675 [Spirochaetae bacterium HGW-Spirochaetae-7]
MSARVSVPSYVTPGTYLENLRFIDEHTDVRNVELLFFIYDDDTRSLLFSESERIAAYSDRFGFTVHMPDEIAGSHEEILEATACFASSFVIHPPKSDPGISPFLRLFDEWRLRYGADRFLLENTRLDRFNRADAAFVDSKLGLPRLCADIGHLCVEGVDPVAWVTEHSDRIAELHVHGFDGSHDHVPFGTDERWIAGLAPFASTFRGTVELELFSWQELEPAIALLRQAWRLP